MFYFDNFLNVFIDCVSDFCITEVKVLSNSSFYRNSVRYIYYRVPYPPCIISQTDSCQFKCMCLAFIFSIVKISMQNPTPECHSNPPFTYMANYQDEKLKVLILGPQLITIPIFRASNILLESYCPCASFRYTYVINLRQQQQ